MFFALGGICGVGRSFVSDFLFVSRRLGEGRRLFSRFVSSSFLLSVASFALACASSNALGCRHGSLGSRFCFGSRSRSPLSRPQSRPSSNSHRPASPQPPLWPWRQLRRLASARQPHRSRLALPASCFCSAALPALAVSVAALSACCFAVAASFEAWTASAAILSISSLRCLGGRGSFRIARIRIRGHEGSGVQCVNAGRCVVAERQLKFTGCVVRGDVEVRAIDVGREG